MTTAACAGPSAAPASTVPTPSGPTSSGPTSSATGTRVTTLARAIRSRWRQRRDVLAPVGPVPAGPWAGADRPDRDRARMLAELLAARPSSAQSARSRQI